MTVLELPEPVLALARGSGADVRLTPDGAGLDVGDSETSHVVRRDRRAVLPAFMEFRLRKLAFPHDEVWMTAGGAAAAVWLPPPGRWQLSRPQQLRLLPSLVRFLGLRTASVLGGLERMEARHPQDRSHWYLFILGTEPAAQGRGLGSALLGQVLARVDANGLPAYLESSNERNLALYGRHGFEMTSEVAIPGGPRIWPMWREPHP